LQMNQGGETLVGGFCHAGIEFLEGRECGEASDPDSGIANAKSAVAMKKRTRMRMRREFLIVPAAITGIDRGFPCGPGLDHFLQTFGFFTGEVFGFAGRCCEGVGPCKWIVRREITNADSGSRGPETVCDFEI
ncbi:hypothetical protein N8529_01130, partial [bacterium]|nr:hypothetical protein [bacterium]